MSAIEIFRLQPGQRLDLQVSCAGTASGWRLEVTRPQEGASSELALRLLDATGRDVGHARVALSDGYLSVARELRRWLQQAGAACDDFDLVPVRPEVLAQSSSAE